MITTTKIDRRRLRKIMADRGLKAHQVAKTLGIKPQTVRAYMCGARGIPKHHWDRVQAAYA
jgi:predicted transcriptional regulator